MAGSKTESVDSLSGISATDEDRQIAQEACTFFENSEYDKCIASLSKVAGKKSKDLKFLQNRAVTEFYKSGQRSYDALKRTLTDQYNKLYGDKAVDGLEFSCLFYNLAVVLYHTKQYRSALNILERLIPFINPIEDTMSKKIVLLLCDLYLNTCQPQKALDMIDVLEKNFSTSSDKSTDKSSDKSSDRESQEKEEGPEIGGSGRASSTERHDTPLHITATKLKLRCYFMLKSNKQIKKELKALTTLPGQANTLFVKAQCESMKGNHLKAMRVLNAHPQLKFSQEEGAKSGGVGVWEVKGGGGDAWAQNIGAMMYYNSVALSFHYRHMPSYAAYFTTKALEENSNAAKDGISKKQPEVPLPHIRGIRYYELTYNLGVQLLHSGQSQAAFDQLLQVVQVYHTNPRLWLRLAECCILCHRKGNDEDRQVKKKMEVISGSDGSAVHRKILLGSEVTANNSTSSGNEAAIPVATMEFAALCLDNALLLLPDLKAGEVFLLPCAPGAPLKNDDIENLRCSVLAAKSYVALYHNDHVVALQCAELLLKQQKLSSAHRYLAHLYCAEALVALDKISAGIEHLNPDLVTSDLSTSIPATAPNPTNTAAEQTSNNASSDMLAEESKGTTQLCSWSPTELRPSKAIMLYNLATAHAIRGEHDKALNFLAMSTQEAGQPLPAQMYHLKIYLELAEGRKRSAQNFIHDQFGYGTTTGGRQ